MLHFEVIIRTEMMIIRIMKNIVMVMVTSDYEITNYYCPAITKKSRKGAKLAGHKCSESTVALRRGGSL